MLESTQTFDLTGFVSELGYSLRETMQAFFTLRVVIATYPDEPIEPAALIALALLRQRSNNFHETSVDEIDNEIRFRAYRPLFARHKAIRGFLTDAGNSVSVQLLERRHAEEEDELNKEHLWSQIRNLQKEIYDYYNVATNMFGEPSLEKRIFSTRGSGAPRHFTRSLSESGVNYEAGNPEIVNHFIQRHEHLLDRTAALAG